jgi:hypothetical protein
MPDRNGASKKGVPLLSTIVSIGTAQLSSMILTSTWGPLKWLIAAAVTVCGLLLALFVWWLAGKPTT